MRKNLSAVIIGSRTGRHLKTPVPLLPFGDTTVLGRTLSAYLDAGFSEIIVGLSYRASEVQASLGTLSDRVSLAMSADPDEDFGSLLRRCCEKVSSSAKGFAIGMGDQPLLGHELLTELADKFVESKSRILVPVCQGHLGFPVFFDAALLGDMKKLAPHAEVWDLLKTRASEVLDYGVYHTAVARHIEDIDDYHAMLRLAGLPVPESVMKAEAAGGDSMSPVNSTEATLLGAVRRLEGRTE